MVGGEINAGDNPPSLLRCPGVVQFGLTSNLLDLGRRSALWRIVALHQCDIARLIHIYVIMLNDLMRTILGGGAVRHGWPGGFPIKLGALGPSPVREIAAVAASGGSRSAAFAVLLSPSAPKFLASSTQDLYSPYT